MLQQISPILAHRLRMREVQPKLKMRGQQKNNAQLNDCASKDNNWTVKVSPTVAAAETAASVAFDTCI